MAVHGYVTHALANRRKLVWLVASYILAFELIAAFALTLLLLFWDPANTILNNPFGYAIRYTIPVALVAALLFRIFYHGHVKHVTRRLSIIALSPERESDANARRFLRIAEEQCITLGIRLPQFGIIEAEEPNALTVGATRDTGLIAVTRGLLEVLDDDELATVLAHEASHIRNGDTKILAANHALMRTSVNIQVNNPLRMESPIQVVLILALPFFLPILLAGGAVTMLAMQMSFQARRGISLSRDLIADGDAVRLTHFPDALIGALKKISGRGAFPESERFDTLLFCGGVSAGLNSGERIKAIASLGHSMMDTARVRRDTRPGGVRTLFQASPVAARKPQGDFRWAPPPMPSLLEILARPKCWAEWHNACVDYGEWKEGEKRDALGLKPKMYIPLAATMMFLLIFHWPTDGDFLGVLALFNPASLMAMAAPGADTIPIFPGASPDARYKQGMLSALIMGATIISVSIPGLRERLYPHVDWNQRKRKSAGELFNIAAHKWSKPTQQENAVEQELARFKRDAGLDRATPLPTPFYNEPANQVVARQPEPHLQMQPQRTSFGRKGL
jgi:heat shock protein HtpX